MKGDLLALTVAARVTAAIEHLRGTLARGAAAEAGVAAREDLLAEARRIRQLGVRS